MNRSPLVTALINPLNLATLGLAVAAGLCAAWWLFPAGLLVWGIMVASIALDPSLRMSAAIERRAPVAPRFQTQFDRIERAQVNIFNSIAQAQPAMRGVLQPVKTE